MAHCVSVSDSKKREMWGEEEEEEEGWKWEFVKPVGSEGAKQVQNAASLVPL